MLKVINEICIFDLQHTATSSAPKYFAHRSLKKKQKLPFFLMTKQDERLAQANDAALVESLFIGDSQADPLF